MSSEKKTGTAVLMLLGWLATGCGGGGSGDNSPPITMPSISPPITRAQSKTVAASSYSDVITVRGYLEGTFPALYTDALNRFQGGSALACGGGTSVATVQDSGIAGFPDAGDSVSITYNNCEQENGTVFNGTVTVTWVSVSQSPSTAVFTVHYHDYDIQDLGLPSSVAIPRTVLDGDATVTYSSGNSISVTFNDLTETGYLGSPVGPNPLAWTFYKKIGFSQATASYVSPQGQGSVTVTNGNFTLDGKITYLDKQNISTESIYTTLSPVISDVPGNKLGGVLGISLYKARQSLMTDNTILEGFSLAEQTNFKLSFPAPGSIKVEADGNHDGVFDSSYVFLESEI